MSVLSKALRLAVFVSVLGGCAAKTTNSTWTGNDEKAFDSAKSATTDSAAPLNEQLANQNTAIQNTVELASLADAGVKITLERGTGYTKVRLSGNTAELPYEVSSMTEPPRLIVDLPGSQGAGTRAYPVDSDNYIKGIRLGSHAEKSRVVFDLTELAGNTGDVYRTVDREAGDVAVTFRSLSESAAATTAAETTTTATLPVAAIAETAAAEEVTANMPAATNIASVSGIDFFKSKETPGSITVKVTGQAPYRLEQTAPTEYTLNINGATISAEATAPQIAPAGSPGIRSTRATQQGNDVIVRMFVDPGVELRASTRGSSIFVLAQPLEVAATSAVAEQYAAMDPTARGQMQPETEAAPAAAEAGPANDDAARQNPTGIPSADGSKIYTGRLISLDLQETDIDNALRIIAEVSNLNIIASDDVTGKVTLRLVDVPWDQALDVILKTNGLDQVTEGNVIRIAPVDKLRQEREALRDAKKAAENLEDLQVDYKRISYARATELKEQVEAVLSERGSVAVDERTNQLIIKDISKGQDSALQLLKKLDLRTPQVLLETQVVEATRGILRDLGFQWNFNYAQSPATGNATGWNFPNSVVMGGGLGTGDAAQLVDFPAAIAAGAGSAVTAVLDSADGSRQLTARLSALEEEGKVKVVSRPQVATVNNKQAEIRSVETVRIRLPDSGLSVATGQGASASGGGSSAFEEIDVGIILRVTPQASPDYYVLLDVYAKSSTFGERVVDNIPSTIEREATSTILVKSGQTFALGGVYRIEEVDRVQGVPFLKDIPVLGHLFRRTLLDKGDEELIFFITPHIVEGSFDASLM